MNDFFHKSPSPTGRDLGWGLIKSLSERERDLGRGQKNGEGFGVRRFPESHSAFTISINRSYEYAPG